ncbi:MAG: hypothetical protein RI841_04370 [Halomonas sp.]|uniref:hypothetical protein n=1 Tax=Halomonas sp. TaxID=1486246 RepID=UPI002870641C|nr:hypothetical protein [Halomonas sp.]MDR9438721.1 hypothetical protein [Halomonas sp.]
MELHPSKQHTMQENNTFLERVQPRAYHLTQAPRLWRAKTAASIARLTWPYRPDVVAHLRFLFVGQGVCLQLPSDSVSQ